VVAAEKSSENACNSKNGINGIIKEINALILAAGGTVECNKA